MTTVGFGDIVPIRQNFFIIDLFYIIIGLAITTMCIDLVGIEYIEKIHVSPLGKVKPELGHTE